MKKRVIDGVDFRHTSFTSHYQYTAAAAPDGMTDASKTPAAQTGHGMHGVEEWET